MLGIMRSPIEIAVVPLDGFHFSNDYLDAHTAVDRDRAGTLRSFKGRPCSFDGSKALASLKLVKNGGEATLPVYSRTLHNPVPGGLRVRREHRIILVEGNFLFLDETPWSEMRELFDLRVFVTERRELLHRRLVERHTRGGSTAEEAERRIIRVDAVNVEEVSGSERRADVVISPDALRFDVR